jgi:MtfA peptidase
MWFVLIVAGYFVFRGAHRYQKYGTLLPSLYLGEKSAQYLQKNFHFYQLLPPKSKKIFEGRVAAFMWRKKFVPREMNEVTWEMQLLISASAIQLTFGFPYVNLSFFKYILVYPDKFFSQANQQYHRGEVNPSMQAIVLSWRYFVEGYLQPDGRNLGLHEMAHALRLENRIMNEEYNFLDPYALGAWDALAEQEMASMQNGNGSFFREYGATCREEFFSVAVENFFERPVEFHKYNASLYDALAKVLRQDPKLLMR